MKSVWTAQDARRQISEELAQDLPLISEENERLQALYRKTITAARRDGMNRDMLNFPVMDRRGSPFRVSNFDLLKNYTLFLGVLSVLNQIRAVPSRGSDAKWLTEFFEKRSKQLIQPHGGALHASDDFILDMLSTTPVLRTDTGTAIELFDPMALTETILEQREKYANVWLDEVRRADDYQLELEREVLEETL